MRYCYFALLLFLLSCKDEKKVDIANEKLIVGIQPYNQFPIEYAKVVSHAIDSFYRFETVILPNQTLSKKAFINVKSPRYRADSIIRFQNRAIPKHVNFVLGLTNEDISTTKTDSTGNVAKPTWKYCDFGIMGLAYKPGKSAIVSKFRIKSKNHKTEMTRLRKVAIHEFGHNLGLSHCPDKKCVMTSAAEKLSTIDNEKLALCDKCKKLINYKY